MPTPSAITGSVATLTPMPSATISASHRIEVMRQRHHRDHDRAPAPEGDEAQHDHRRVDVEQHRAVRLRDDDVGRRLDAGAAGGQQERAVLVVVRPRRTPAAASTTRSSVSALWSAR